MSIFGKPVAQITTADLQELMIEQAVENVRLEFKSQVPSKEETLKKVSSFANTYGGDLVVGAAASSSDGKITELPGVEPKASYKQTVVQWCFAGATPPLTVEVSDPVPAPAGDGKVCYVIRTAESELAPHFLNARNGIYVRTDEFSGKFQPQLATENELRYLLGRRKLVRERRAFLIGRARERFAAAGPVAARRTPEAKRTRDYLGAHFELVAIPRFPSGTVCNHSRLVNLIEEINISWRQVGFPRRTCRTITQHESAIILEPCGQSSFLEANIWGLTYYTSPIGERDREYIGIHTNEFLGKLLVFLRHARLFIHRVGYSGPLHIELLMQDIRNVPWIAFPRGFPEEGPNSEIDNTVEFAMDTTTDELENDCDRLAGNLLQYVFFATNWPGVADNQEKLSSLVQAGYEYNGW